MQPFLSVLFIADDLLSKEAVLSQRLQYCTAIQLSHLFHTGSAQHQQDIIQHKLWSLQRRMFATDYRRLGRFVCSHLLPAVVADDISSERLQVACPAQCCKTEKASGTDAWQKIEERGRLALYDAVEELEANVTSIVAGRLLALQRQVVLQYQCLLTNIITDPTNTFSVLNDLPVSRSLDRALEDLDTYEKDAIKADDKPWRYSEVDRAAIDALERELSNGWFAGSTVLSVEGQDVLVPNIACASYQKLLLHEASLKPTVTQLFPDDIETLLKNDHNANTISVTSSCGAAINAETAPVSASELMFLEAAGQVYRLIHGIELCCGLDSPSCVLSTLLIIDKQDQLKHIGQKFYGAGDTHLPAVIESSSSGVQTTLLSQSWSDEEMLRGRVTMDAETCAAYESMKLGSCQKDDGIFGTDTWLTSPIESSPCAADSSLQTESTPVIAGELMSCEGNPENWLLQPDDFSYMNMINSDLTMSL